MRKQLADLRRIMKEEGIDAYLVPTTDFHGSEYVNPYFRCREYISGFDGCAGTLLVTEEGAGLWTDGTLETPATEAGAARPYQIRFLSVSGSKRWMSLGSMSNLRTEPRG